MSSPYPSPWQAYEALPYHFSWTDQQPVVTFPVAGPEPYDTLSVVRTTVFVTVYEWADGETERRRVTMPTGLVVPEAVGGPAPVHSSSATVRMMQISAESGFVTNDDNTDFTIAVDGIDPVSAFDASGRWTIGVDVASRFWQVFAGATVEVSSWVLYRRARSLPRPERIDPWVIGGFPFPAPSFRDALPPLGHPAPPPLRAKRPRGPRRRPTGSGPTPSLGSPA